MREIQVNLTLTFRVPETGLTVNGVLLGLKSAMSRIFLTILECLVAAREEQAIEELQKELPGHYVRNGHRSTERQLRTSFGVFRYRLAQLRDRYTGKTMVPLLACGFLPRYRRYTEDTKEAPIGLVVHLSYRRSTAEVERICEQAAIPSARTIHRELQQFAETYCQWPDLKKVPYRFLMVDGTGVRYQGPRGARRPKGTMRWALASLGEGEPFEPVGFWVQQSWKDIRKDLEQRLNYEGLEVLISDGEPGIEEALLTEGMRPQRCTLHGKRDFAYILYLDGYKKLQQEPLRNKLESLPPFYLSTKHLEHLSDEDRPRVRKMAEKTKQGFHELIEMLDPEKYPKARVYIENLSQSIDTFFDWWLETGEWIPWNTNAIESDFSRVKNRVWSVGKRWSENGLLNWLRVAIAKIFCPELWREFWTQYYEAYPPIELSNIRVSWRWC
jgi:transposase-like protein